MLLVCVCVCSIIALCKELQFAKLYIPYCCEPIVLYHYITNSGISPRKEVGIQMDQLYLSSFSIQWQLHSLSLLFGRKMKGLYHRWKLPTDFTLRQTRGKYGRFCSCKTCIAISGEIIRTLVMLVTFLKREIPKKLSMLISCNKKRRDLWYLIY